MSRREYDIQKSSGDLVGALSITESKTISATDVAAMIAKGATKMSMFLVGGGGGGSGDYYQAGVTGHGGCSGECLVKNDITLYAKKIEITIGIGGAGGEAGEDSDAHSTGYNGTDTILIYNNTTYTAKGGYGGDSKNMPKNTIFTNYPRGSRKWGGCGYGYNNPPDTAYSRIKAYYTLTPEEFMKKYSTKTDIHYSIAGETGTKNPFDSEDSMVYGCGGGAGYNPYHWYTQATDKTIYSKIQSEFPNYGGDNNAGGGRGGYGDNNTKENKGSDATSYGSGGGGGAFCSKHTYSTGGNGMQGIVKLYFYK